MEFWETKGVARDSSEYVNIVLATLNQGYTSERERMIGIGSERNGQRETEHRKKQKDEIHR